MSPHPPGSALPESPDPEAYAPLWSGGTARSLKSLRAKANQVLELGRDFALDELYARFYARETAVAVYRQANRPSHLAEIEEDRWEPYCSTFCGYNLDAEDVRRRWDYGGYMLLHPEGRRLRELHNGGYYSSYGAPRSNPTLHDWIRDAP